MVILVDTKFLTSGIYVLGGKLCFVSPSHSAIFVDGDDNLVFYKKIIEFSKVALNDLGVLYLECHTDRVKSIKNLLKINNFKKIMIKEDLNGRERMIKAYK